MPMFSKTETAARRLVAEIYRATGDRPMRGLQQAAQRAKADADAVIYARDQHWIELSPGPDPHSVHLTQGGRNLME
jgi:hypothetical protein